MLVVGVLLGVMLSVGAARAEPDKRVHVVIAPETNDALDAVVRERVTAAGARPEIEHEHAVEPAKLLRRRAAASEALAHVWIDFSDGERVVVLLLDERLERGLLRYVSRAAGDEIAREEVGHLLQTAVEGLMAGMKIGIGREELLTPKPSRSQTASAAPTPSVALASAPSSPASSSAGWHVRAGGAYGVEAFGAGAAIHGPGATLDVLRRAGGIAFGARIAGQVRFPAQLALSPFTLRMESWAARASALGLARLGGGWSLEGALGVGFDVARVTPISAGPGATLGVPSTQVHPLLRASLAIAWGPPRIALGVTADVDLGSERFEVVENGARRTLFSANAVRPGLVLEIGTP